MSATGRKKGGHATERNEADAYLTPPAHAFTCAALLDLRPGMRVLEPSAGEGAFVRAIHDAHGLVPYAVDRRPEACTELLGCIPGVEVPVRNMRFEDVLDPDHYDAVVGNPPYIHAIEHVQHGLYVARPDGLVAYLLRINFLATQGRYPFFRRLPPWRIYVLAERPDFTGGGGDATEYAFIAWRKGWTGDTVTRWISCEDETFRAEDIARVRALDWTRGTA